MKKKNQICGISAVLARLGGPILQKCLQAKCSVVGKNAYELEASQWRPNYLSLEP